jgi:hypothetical protein
MERLKHNFKVYICTVNGVFSGYFEKTPNFKL